MNEVFTKYAEVTAQIKALQDEQKVMLAAITEELAKQETAKISTDVGTFSTVVRKVYTYSDNVKNAENAFKTIKKQEEKEGIATYTESFSLRFTPVKIKD